jgi:3-hydroxy-9,10-secoandrosta-1,3,5(10)-triene-9,17-dione monooxygenase reductase component
MTDHLVEPATFRKVLGHFPTGVAVVTGSYDHAPVGMAIGSFASVSLDPPLVGFFPSKTSSSWPKIHRSGSFAVNILGEGQEDVARTFASTDADKFRTIGWREARSGCPILDNVIGWIDCEIADVVEAGDHYFVSGLVLDLDVEGEGGPLVFFRGGSARAVS